MHMFTVCCIHCMHHAMGKTHKGSSPHKVANPCTPADLKDSSATDDLLLGPSLPSASDQLPAVAEADQLQEPLASDQLPAVAEADSCGGAHEEAELHREDGLQVGDGGIGACLHLLPFLIGLQKSEERFDGDELADLVFRRLVIVSSLPDVLLLVDLLLKSPCEHRST